MLVLLPSENGSVNIKQHQTETEWKKKKFKIGDTLHLFLWIILNGRFKVLLRRLV